MGYGVDTAYTWQYEKASVAVSNVPYWSSVNIVAYPSANPSCSGSGTTLSKSSGTFTASLEPGTWYFYRYYPGYPCQAWPGSSTGSLDLIGGKTYTVGFDSGTVTES